MVMSPEMGNIVPGQPKKAIEADGNPNGIIHSFLQVFQGRKNAGQTLLIKFN